MGNLSTAESFEKYIISHVDEAIREGYIQVWYQPIINTFSEKVSIMEALSRWRDPAYGLLNPGKFIGILEKEKLLYKVDLYVLEKVCQDMRKLLDADHDCCQTSINLSRHDLEIPDLLEKINSIVNRYQIPHSMIHFEITETALIENEEVVGPQIGHFHKEGYEVWLDDFGSGYSSFNTMHKYDFDCIKIDMLFLRGKNEKTPILMRSIVDLAKRLGMLTLTEGVETKDEYFFLKRIGCAYVQGYLFSKPDSLEAMLHKDNLQQLGMESSSDRIFYRQVGKVNVLDIHPYEGEESEEKARELPVAIFELEGEDYRFLYMNHVFRTYVKEIAGVTLTTYREPEKMEGPLPLYHQIRDMVKYADANGRAASYHFVQDTAIGKLFLRKVAQYGERRAYLLCIMSIEVLSRHETQEVTTIKDLYSLFSSLDEVVPERGTFRHIYGEMEDAEKIERMPLREVMNVIAERYIHPSERERAMEFFDPDTIISRVDSTPNHAMNAFFHMVEPDGSYQWRRVLFAEAPSQGGMRKYMLCKDRNTAGWTEELLRSVEERGMIPADLAGGYTKDPIPGIRDLWDALARQDRLGIFWKDKDRRFLGVNRAFRKYYHMTEKDLIGNNDEDMGWHPDPEPFKRDEESVLRDGASIRGAIGKCLVDGEVRTIMANKEPIRRGDQIIGLVGYFTDVTDTAEDIMSLSQKKTRDLVTGLPNAVIMSEVCQAYAERYREKGTHFGVIFIQLLGMKQFVRHFGEAEAASLYKLVGKAISEAGLEGATIGYPYPGRYGVILPAGSEEELKKKAEKLTEVLHRIRKTKDGTPVTLYFMVGSCLYDDTRSIEEVTSLAEADMKQPEL